MAYPIAGTFVVASAEVVAFVEVAVVDGVAVVCVGARGFVNLFAWRSKGLANWKRSCQLRVPTRCFDRLVDRASKDSNHQCRWSQTNLVFELVGTRTIQDQSHRALEVEHEAHDDVVCGQDDGDGASRAFSCFVVGTKSSSASAVVAADELTQLD